MGGSTRGPVGRGQAWDRGFPSWGGASDGCHHPSPHRSGAVVTLECVEKLIRKDMVDPVNGEKLTDRDIIVLQRVSRAPSEGPSSGSPLRGPAPTFPVPSPRDSAFLPRSPSPGPTPHLPVRPLQPRTPPLYPAPLLPSEVLLTLRA